MVSWGCATQMMLSTSLLSTKFSRTTNSNCTDYDDNGSNEKCQVVEFRTPSLQFARWTRKRRVVAVVRVSTATMRDRSKNRMPLQRGRNLSIEAIQTVQALKRANKNKNNLEEQLLLLEVLDSKFRRLLKLDMVAVLRELLRQNECLLALLQFRQRQIETSQSGNEGNCTSHRNQQEGRNLVGRNRWL